MASVKRRKRPHSHPAIPQVLASSSSSHLPVVESIRENPKYSQIVSASITLVRHMRTSTCQSFAKRIIPKVFRALGPACQNVVASGHAYNQFHFNRRVSQTEHQDYTVK
jgi:hypothetical protein